MVQAMRVTVSNVESVAQWIRTGGGAVAGLCAVSTGRVWERGIWLGSLDGLVRAYVGDWVISDALGDFHIMDDVQLRSYLMNLRRNRKVVSSTG